MVDELPHIPPSGSLSCVFTLVAIAQAVKKPSPLSLRGRGTKGHCHPFCLKPFTLAGPRLCSQ